MTGPFLRGNQGVSLRVLDLGMAKEMSVIANDAEVAKNLRDIFPHPYLYDNAVGFINFVLGDTENPSWPIFFHEKLAGMIGLVRQSDVYRHQLKLVIGLADSFTEKALQRRL